MIRKIVQFVICIGLAPLLAAQEVCQAENQVSRATPAETLFAYRISMRSDESVNRADDSGSLYGLSVVPFDLPVELAPVDPAALANATVNSTLTFRVVRNVIVRRGVFNRSSYADAYGGTLIEGKVIQIREGMLRTRDGRTELRVKEVLVGKRIKLELQSSPGGPARCNGIARKVIVWPVQGTITVGESVLFMILFPIFCRTGCDL